MPTFLRAVAAAAALAATPAMPALAQAESAEAAAVEAAPADVASEDAIIEALYDVISGPAGPRDWNRFRSLFAPGARLIPIAAPEESAARAVVWTVEEYAARAGANFMETPFFETEIARSSQTYGGLTHAFSTYEARRSPDGEPFMRGINSIQLLDDGERWWIVTVFWQPETRAHPLPERYLPD